MLARNRIEFLDLELLGHRALILRGRIKMARVGARYQLYLVTHSNLLNRFLDRFTTGTHFREDHVDTLFVDRP